MADESVVAEPSVDEQLDELFKPKESKPGASAPALPVKPIPGDTPPATASSPGAETDLLAALEAIEEEKPVEVKPGETPALSADQKTILDAIPTVEAFKNVESRLQGYENFTGLLAGGKFESVEAELTHWNKDVLDGWVEHVYQKHKEAFVDRFIAEAEGKGKSPDLVKLEKEVRTLKDSLEEKNTANTESDAKKQLNANFQAYNQHVDGLFDQIKFNKADRRYVTADLNARIAADPKVLSAIKSGNAKAVNPLFKAACREYLQRDKEVADGTAAKVAEQEKKKLPLGGGAAEVQDEIPEDLNKVKTKDLESWSTRALDKLLGKKK